MLVVAIAGLMSILAVATLRQTAMSSRERGAARGVSALIKRARSMAMQQHKIVSVVVITNGIKLQACPAQFGTNNCAGVTTPTDVPGAQVVYGTEQESGGVTLASSATLTFNVLGLPTAPGSAPFEYTVNHPETPGVATIRVTGGGDVRVQ